MKRLYKSRKEKIIDGVCGGIAEYFEIDPVIVRLVAVVLLFAGGVGVIAYIVGMIIIPVKTESVPEGEADNDSTGQPRERSGGGSNFLGIALIIIGLFFILGNVPMFRGCYWWFRSLSWDFILPAALIVVGIYLLVKKSKPSVRNEDNLTSRE